MENTTPSQDRSEKKPLILALIAGMCGDAILSWMTITPVPFSIFPWIAMALAVQALYQDYLVNPLSEDMPLVGLGCFLVGGFGHSAFVKAQYPEAGSNFFSIIILMGLLFWLGRKLGYVGAIKKSEAGDL